MGHTCISRERGKLERELDYQASRMKEANDELVNCEKSYGEARRALDAFNSRYSK
jgi:hypothetical protein